MPSSATEVLILLVAVFPGLLGNTIYRRLLGVDWREKEWQSILRLLGFSVFGIVIYSIVGALFDLPPPAHLLPETYKTLKPSWASFRTLYLPYLGHIGGGALAGLLGASGIKLLARYSRSTAYPSAWDDFVRSLAPQHWVVVALLSGDVYAGKLVTVDVAVTADDRDLVLEEPCIFEKSSGNYLAVNYQFLFLPAAQVFSIAAVHNPQVDMTRVVPVGQMLFTQGALDAPKSSAQSVLESATWSVGP